ncbi:ATP-binding protein [Microbacterium terrisoli]|uniref:ATP-binding protein n=1 Tax=Microbacterium terrisoli TaxID=3242192 RepID=UPI002804485F|nr:hypothetical protein [Microbacterium protaetiae]
MTESIDVQALGTRVRLRFAPGATAEWIGRVRGAWSGCGIPGSDEADATPDRTVEVPADGDPEWVLESLSVRVTLQALDHQRGRMLLFHAAGIALDDGRVIAFVGPSGRGKTTLSRILGRHYAYVSDESVAVDAHLSVLPYRKPLSVVRAGRPKEQVSPEQAGLRDLPDAALRLAAVVFLDRRDEPCDPTVEPLPFTEVVREIIPQMSFLRELPRPLHALAQLGEQVGGFRRLRYSRVEDLVGIVDDVISGSDAAMTWRSVSVGPGARTDAAALDAGPDVGPDAGPAAGPATPDAGPDAGPDAAAARIGPDVIDVIEVDGGLAVFSGGTIRVLEGIAPVLWESAVAGRTSDEIVADVVARHGAPPDADPRALVDAALAELVDAGVLSPNP